MHWGVRTNFIFRLVGDFFCLTIAFCFAHIVFGNKYYSFNRTDIQLVLGSIILWYLISKFVHLYDDFRSRSFAYEMVSILKMIVIHYITFSFILFYFFNSYANLRWISLLYTGFALILIPIEKFALRRLFRSYRKKGANIRNVIIAGAGEVGMNFWKTIRENEHFGYRLIGFVDDGQKPQLNGEWLGSIAQLNEILLQKNEVDDIVIALPNNATKKIEEIVSISEKNAKRVRIIPDYYRLGSGNFKVSNFGAFPLVTVRSLPLDDSENILFKRVFDILLSAIVLVFILSWLIPIVSIIIKLSSKGPVFFKQERWGLNNKMILCYKFRSMVMESKDIDEEGSYKQALLNDPRVTKIGRFLRKTNIDEFPQFWNVLRGDMSIVGPRPHPIPLNLDSKDKVTNYMLRHFVKPGITGWAQVNGYRGETKTAGLMQKRVDLDMWYIENWSFWLDSQIIFQTIINMMVGDKNAY